MTTARAKGTPQQKAGSKKAGERAPGAPAPKAPERPDPAGDETAGPLLRHSLTELREIWLPLLKAAGVRSVVEIGSETGAATALLATSLRDAGGSRLVVIDPDPGLEPPSGRGLDVEVVRGYSPEALDGLAPADAYLIDGDHNYATVSAELAAIEATAAAADRPALPLVALHDVGWPAGRRDQYYAPDRIPPARRQRYTWDDGVVVGTRDVVRGGFRGEGEFAWATTEGGPANGVLTAVDDFVAERPHLNLRVVPAVFGLGILVDSRASWAPAVEELLTPWAENPVLARLERNRLDLYLRVIELQDQIAELSRARQRDWARVDAERAALAERELVALEKVGQLERELHDERRTTEALRSDLAARAQAPSRAPISRRRR